MTHHLIDAATGEPLTFRCRAAPASQSPRIEAIPAGPHAPARFATPQAAAACAAFFIPHRKTYTTGGQP